MQFEKYAQNPNLKGNMFTTLLVLWMFIHQIKSADLVLYKNISSYLLRNRKVLGFLW